jgi:hypothetical protein
LILNPYDNVGLNSTYIYFEQTVRPKIIDLRIYAGTVPTEHLGTLDVKIKDSLQHIVRDGIDMKRMPMVINREERRVRDAQFCFLVPY